MHYGTRFVVGLRISEFRIIELILNVKLSGYRDLVGLLRIPDYTGIGLEGFDCIVTIHLIICM